MSDGADENPDRAAILERRKQFVARSLDACPPNRKSRALLLALSGLATACPCLKVASETLPPEEPKPTDDAIATGGSDADTDAGGEQPEPEPEPEPEP